MKVFGLVLAAALAAASDVTLKYSDAALVSGSQAAGGSASALSLARHAIEALGLPVAAVPVAPLPVAADAFLTTSSYGLVVVEGVAHSVGGAQGSYGFQKVMALDDASSGHLPELVAVLAQGVKSTNSKNVVVCAGETVCGAIDKKDTGALAGDAAAIEAALWTKYDVLQKGNKADERVVAELANLKRVVESVKVADASVKGLFVASVSDLSGLPKEKKDAATDAVAHAVEELQAALAAHYPSAGVQVLSLSQKMKVDVHEISKVADISRRLSNLAANATAASTAVGNSTVKPLTIENIAEYQIILWSSVVLVVAALLAVSMLCGMDANRDSLLYAKFLTDASNRKID